MKLLSLLLLPVVPAFSKAILGVDLGSLYMKVALVQRNSPLEIVTNMHSKRKTEQMVLFDSGSRFYGADASSLVARKPTLTSQAMSLMLGRDESHPTIQVLAERHYPIRPSYNETRSGVCLTIDGNPFTPEELVAMVLSHAKDITAAYGVKTQVKDCVLTVPSFYTQHERQALLDAAELADLNVLALIDENTAAGLHFGIDRIDDEPKNYLFYNMGASALQVSIMKYHSYERKEKGSSKKKVGTFQVLGKGWDGALGGNDFDTRIVDFMATEFNEVWNKKRNDGETKDVSNFPRPMAKLKIQASKVKQVLSANTEMPIFIDALYDDTNYQTHLTRSKFEDMCHDLFDRSSKPIEMALKAANMTLDDIDAVELIGGGMRVPRVQEAIKSVLGDKLELGMHINSDESMALGAAFHGANVSTAFKVRHVGMTDINPFPIAVSLGELDASDSEDEESWSKRATIFKTDGKVGVKKTIAFTQDKDISVAVDYEESDNLPEGTSKSIENYKISGIAAFAKEMEEKGLAKPKVSLQFELSTSGLAKLVKAEAAVEETVIVKEEVEVEDDEAEEEKEEEAASEETPTTEGEAAPEEASATEETAAEETKTEGDEGKNETKEADKKEKVEKPKKKKMKTIEVEKEKKKVHKRSLTIETYHVGRVQPYSDSVMTESKDKLAELARIDNERMMLEEVRNRYEAYIYHIKNKLIDEEEAISAISSEEQREELLKNAAEAEDWMYDDGYDADLATYEEKYIELSEPAEKVFFRLSEVSARAEAATALREKLDKIDTLVAKWATSMPQVTEEERTDIITKVEDVRKLLLEKEEAQAAADPTADPVFTSADLPLLTKDIQSKLSTLSKRPKPKVEAKKDEKNETDSKAENTTEADGDADVDADKETSDAEEEKEEDPEKGEEASSEEKAAEDEL